MNDVDELRLASVAELRRWAAARAEAARRCPDGSPEQARHLGVLKVLRRELTRRGVLP